MKAIYTAVLPVFLAGCATSGDPAELEALVEEHDAAWNAHDPDRLTAMFTVDGTLVTPSGTRAEGHTALREIFASPGPTKQTTSSSTIAGVQWLDGDVAVVDMYQTLDGPGVAILGANQAHAVLVMRKVDGDWKVAAARPFVRRHR